MRNVTLGLVGILGLSLFGCAPAEPSSQSQMKLGTKQSYIFHGTPDTTHTAVVALLSQQSECSGTIIKVSGNTGYVLTAAHCLAAGDVPEVAVQANDYNDQNGIAYKVTATKAHPSYNGDTYDFGMVTITGVGPETPVLPAMTKDIDNLASGSTVDFVGYGITENDDPNGNTANSLRRHVTGTLDQVTSLQLKYSQVKSGPCEGDSGGPSLSTVGGQEYVSGVTSYGDQACVQYGVSSRVSAVYDSFIKPYMDGSTPVQTCQECGDAVTTGVGACTSTVKDCQNDADCSALLDCFGKCKDGDNACYQSCATANKTGADVYFKINTCICDTGCKAECTGDASCQAPTGGTCAYTFEEATCTTCADGMCCDPQKTCSDNANCNACVTGMGGTDCANDPLAKALFTCLQTSCKDPCASLFGGGTMAACAYTFPDATCGTCADGMCCDVQKACSDDTTCNACVTTDGATGCDTSAPYKALVNCLGTSCADPCASLFGGGTGGTGGSTGGAGAGGSGTAGQGQAGTGQAGTSSGGSSPFGGGGTNAAGTGTAAGAGGTSSTAGGAAGTASTAGGSAGTASTAGGAAGTSAAGTSAAGTSSTAGGATGNAGGGTDTGTPNVTPQDSSSDSGCSVASPRNDAGGLSASLLLGFAALLGAGRRRRNRA